MKTENGYLKGMKKKLASIVITIAVLLPASMPQEAESAGLLIADGEKLAGSAESLKSKSTTCR